MKLYEVFKISCIVCFIGAAIYSYANNMQMATYMFLAGFYADWLAEKEK